MIYEVTNSTVLCYLALNSKKSLANSKKLGIPLSSCWHGKFQGRGTSFYLPCIQTYSIIMNSKTAAESGPATSHVIYPVDKDTGFAMVSPMAPVRRQSLTGTVLTEQPSVQHPEVQKKDDAQAVATSSTPHMIYPVDKDAGFSVESPMPSSVSEPPTDPTTTEAVPTAGATVAPNKRPSMTFLQTLGLSSKKKESSDPPATSTAHVIYPVVPENSFTMVSPMSSSRRQSHSSGTIQPPMGPLEDSPVVSKESTTPAKTGATPHTIYPVEKNTAFTMESPLQSSRNQSHTEDQFTVTETVVPNKRPSMTFLETLGFTSVTTKEKTPDVSVPATAHVIYPVVKDTAFTMESPMASGRRASHTQEVPVVTSATPAGSVAVPIKRPSGTTAEPLYTTPKKEINPDLPISSSAHVIYPVMKDTSFTMESPMASTRRPSQTVELLTSPATAAVPAKPSSVKIPEVLQVTLQPETNPDALLPSTAHVIYPVVKDTRFTMESPMAGGRRPSLSHKSSATNG